MRTVSSLWRLTAILLGAAVASLGATPPAAAQLANSAWPMLQHDERHTGRSHLLGPNFPSDGPAPENVAVWNGFDKVKSSPTIAPDGTIYVGVGWSVCAINPTVSNGVMEDQWETLDPPNPNCRRLAADASPSSAAIGVDGTLYIGDRGNALNAFDPDGNLVWRYINGHEGDVKTSPVIGPDGTIYVGFIQNFDGPGTLAAIYPGLPPCPSAFPCSPGGVGGTLKWSYPPGNFVTTSSPALDSGVVYFGDVVGWLHAVQANTGDLLWKLKIGNNISASPVIVPPGEPHAGRIYVGSTNGLSAVNPNTGALDPTFAAGTPTPGTFTTNGMVDQTPALAADGTIYAGSKSGQLKTFYAINPDGIQKWVFGPVQTPADNGAFAVVSADGTIYVAIGKTVYALRPDNGMVLWSYTVPMNIISFPAIGGDATSATSGSAILYVPSYDGNVYALSRFPITVNPSAADDFNRGNSTNLGAATLANPPGQAPWTEVGGDQFSISNNELRTSAGTGNHIAVLPSVTGPTQTVAADFASVNSTAVPKFGVVLRYQNSQNFYLAYRKPGNSSLLRIAKIVGGVETVLDQVGVPNPQLNTLFRLSATATGTTISLDLNGVPKLSVNDTEFSTGTIGILVNPGTSSTAMHRIDNFTANVQ